MKMENEYFLNGKIHEECGVFGVYHVSSAASLSYFGLHALQHRGQEGCGIAVSDGRQVKSHKGRGLISEVFSEAPLQRLSGDIAIGHVRYSTAGGNLLEATPVSARCRLS